MDRRRRLLHGVMMVSSVFLVALFAVQLHASFKANAREVQDNPVGLGSSIFNTIVDETVDPVNELKQASDEMANIVELELRKEKVKDEAIQKITEDLNAVDPVVPETPEATADHETPETL